MSKINLRQLKDYLKLVLELEGQLYKHQKLIEGYTEKREQNIPKEPTKCIPSMPSSPLVKHTPSLLETVGISSAMKVVYLIGILLAGISFFCIFFPLAIAVVEGDGWGSILRTMEFWGILLSAIPIYCFYLINKEKKKQADMMNAQNKLEQSKHEEKLRAYHTEVANIENEYSNKMQQYYQDVENYNRETASQLVKLDEIKRSLQKSLTKLYSQNIVYSKYRNLVAISTIYEYIESGRCTELEGPNGAYNMYEGELRSNIIICSLSQIISDLGQIKNGQYVLYEQINRSNNEVTRILNNIYDAQMLTAYYAESAAKAASADRYTVGVVY